MAKISVRGLDLSSLDLEMSIQPNCTVQVGKDTRSGAGPLAAASDQCVFGPDCAQGT